MYRCQHCGTVTSPRVSVETVVVETRPRVYPFRKEAHREIVWKERLNRREKQDDPGGTGREIVREIRVCPPCKRAPALSDRSQAVDVVAANLAAAELRTLGMISG